MRVMLTNSPAYVKDMNRHFSYGRFGCSDPVPYSKGGMRGTDTARIDDHYNPYPWSLGYASSYLKEWGKADVRALDAQAEDMNEIDWTEAIEAFKPDILVVDLPTISFSLCMDVLEGIKRDGGMQLILAGLHPSGVPDDVMREYPFVDYIIKGDYGIPMKHFLEGAGPEKCFGFVYRAPDGKVVHSNAPVEFIPFDDMPYPDREDLPCDNYHDFEIAGKPTIHMVTSRGCPFTCSYCNVRVFWPEHMYWARKPSDVVNEMLYVKEKYGAKQIYFDDDIMTHDQDRVKALAKEIIDRKVGLPFTFMGDINIKEETLALLAEAGGCGLKFGVESINPKTLADIKKSWVSADKVKTFVAMCKRYNIWCHGDFIVGLPQDTKESAETMLEFALGLDLDTAQIYSAQPLPGTPFYRQCQENGWLVAKSWEEYDGNYKSPVSYPWFSREEIEEILVRFKREWEYAAVKQYFLKPSRILRYIKGRGFRYFLRKVWTLIRKWGPGKDHIYVAGS